MARSDEGRERGVLMFDEVEHVFDERLTPMRTRSPAANSFAPTVIAGSREIGRSACGVESLARTESSEGTGKWMNG